MKQKRGLIILTILMVATLLTLLPLSLTRALPAGAPLSRPATPVTVNGNALAPLLGTPISELRLHRYGPAGWEAIPFQVDEVTATGVFTSSEDGLLDGNDQLSFMSQDAGFQSSLLWVADAEARSHQRVEIELFDPVTQENGAVYLYRSTTLALSSASYVSWDGGSQQLMAAAYSAGFAPESFLGLDSFQLSGGDLLDRQKLRVNLTLTTPPFPPISQQLNEEQLASLLNVPFSVTLRISGPIRALGGNEAQQIAFYGWQYETSLSLDLSDVVTGFTTIHVEQIRSSRDWLDPAVSGLGSVTYFDSNTPAGVPVDGAPDSIANTPAPRWQELNTAQGHILTLAAIEPGLGTAAGYYLDNSQPNGNDTGDGRSFGDHGFVISEPNGVITVSETVWIWPSGGGTAGSQAQAFIQQPLAVTTTGQSYMPLTKVYLPIINRP